MSLQSPSAPEPIQRGEPLRETVYRRLVAVISSGQCPPGAALTEASLSRLLEVSRTPVREALLRLEAEGVLESALARGFTVRPLTRREAEELYPILASLESLAVKTSVDVDDSTFDSLRAVMRELVGCESPVRRWQLDSQWHDLLVAASGNRKLMEMTESLRTNLSRYELAYMREVTSRSEADDQHHAILKALTNGDQDRASSLIRTHWLQGEQLVLRWLSKAT